MGLGGGNTRKIALVGIVAILLSLIVLTGPVAAQDSDGWYRKEWAPKQYFIHDWTGTLLFPTDDGLQFWELYTEMRMMMPGMPGMGDGEDFEWVKMTIVWDPLAQKGEIVKFEHHGMNLRFTGWEGIIWFNPVYHFQVSGQGMGFYRTNGTWYNLIIRGAFEGEYYPLVMEDPFKSGISNATERAILLYRFPSVGGEIIPMNSLTLLAPWILIATAATTIGFAISRRKNILTLTALFSSSL